MFFDHDWLAYHEGRVASFENNSDPKRAGNPYEKYTFAWKSWNAGWNSHMEEVRDAT